MAYESSLESFSTLCGQNKFSEDKFQTQSPKALRNSVVLSPTFAASPKWLLVLNCMSVLNMITQVWSREWIFATSKNFREEDFMAAAAVISNKEKASGTSCLQLLGCKTLLFIFGDLR